MDLEKLAPRLRGHSDEVLSLIVLSLPSSAPVLASGGADGAVWLWDTSTLAPLAHLDRSALVLPSECQAGPKDTHGTAAAGSASSKKPEKMEDDKMAMKKEELKEPKDEEPREDEEEMAVTCLTFAPKSGILFAGLGRFIVEIQVSVSATVGGEGGGAGGGDGAEAGDTHQWQAAMKVVRVHSVCSEEVNSLSVHEKETYLAAGEDSGEIVVLDLAAHSVYKRLKRHHTNIVTSVAFRPRRPWEVVSGSMDSTSIHWDFSKSKVLEAWNFTQSAPSNMPSINPPMVFSLAMHEEGRCVAVGLGDTTARVVRFGQKNLRGEITHTLQGHTLGVSAVHFPAGKEAVLVTGGVDKRLVVWRLSVGEDKALVRSLVHTSKINALASTPAHVFVADQSKGIAVYRWK